MLRPGNEVALLGIDWGTSNLRVHQIDARGAIVQSRRSAHGILNVPANGFARVLEEQAGDWLLEWPEVPVVGCGMVGARQGWVEVPYLQCPVAIDDLARALAPVALADGRILHLVAGAAWRGGVDLADVIRGEETTIIGCVGRHGCPMPAAMLWCVYRARTPNGRGLPTVPCSAFEPR